MDFSRARLNRRHDSFRGEGLVEFAKFDCRCTLNSTESESDLLLRRLDYITWLVEGDISHSLI